MGIEIGSSGSFKNTERFLAQMARGSNIFDALEKFGEEGVAALAAATPQKTGYTASQWYYEIKKERNSWSIIWGNKNVRNGVPIVVLIQMGHATRTGGLVPGEDFINPALRSIFDRIVREAEKVVNKA